VSVCVRVSRSGCGNRGAVAYMHKHTPPSPTQPPQQALPSPSLRHPSQLPAPWPCSTSTQPLTLLHTHPPTHPPLPTSRPPKDRVDDVIAFLVARIEGSMRELLPDDFALYPPEAWKGRGWDFVDSMDPKGWVGGRRVGGVLTAWTPRGGGGEEEGGEGGQGCRAKGWGWGVGGGGWGEAMQGQRTREVEEGGPRALHTP
jgi:hypothetical protein